MSFLLSSPGGSGSTTMSSCTFFFCMSPKMFNVRIEIVPTGKVETRLEGSVSAVKKKPSPSHVIFRWPPNFNNTWLPTLTPPTTAQPHPPPPPRFGVAHAQHLESAL